jgi:HlyD family secretion protein
MAHRWRLPVIASTILLVALAALWWRSRSNATEHARSKFESEVVDRGAIRATVTATGVVNPTVQVQVGTQVSGTIRALGADFNSTVEPGQMIAQIVMAVVAVGSAVVLDVLLRHVRTSVRT